MDIEKYYRCNIPMHKTIIEEQRQAQAQYIGPTIEKNGRVSIVILSCKRLHLLRQTCKALFSHIDQYEPSLDIEYILVDNGSDKKLINYAKSVRFNKVIANPKNLGIAQGLNQGFSVASGEFIFQLEDDWLCNTNLPLIKMSVEVLREFDDIGIVRLKQTELQKMGGRNIGAERQTKTGIKFWPWHPTKMPCGSYCFGCGIFKRQACLYTGPIPTNTHPRAAELAYARMFEKFYNGARVGGLLEAFVHIGGGVQRSSGWNDKI